ncbi:response regulator [Candidatus Sumerlaeota bacterium]|nr:response regulator [Candidatus Sumerlaeota bacterium]
MNENRWRILAIDDHEDTLEVIRMTLGETYDLLTLRDPLEVYDMLQIFEPDLLILDIMMPKITGFQVLDLLQKNPAYKDLPIMILSAKNTTREIKYGYKLGARLYLTKPFDPDRLLKNVNFLFENTPPPVHPKKFDVNQVLVHVQLKKSFQMGGLRLVSSLLHKDEMSSDEVQKAVEEAKKRRKTDQSLDQSGKWID